MATFFERVGRAFRKFWEEISEPAPQAYPTPEITAEVKKPPRKPPPPRDTRPVKPFDDDRRQQAFNRIMSWFPKNGEYVTVNGKSMYQHANGDISNSPANPRTVRRNVEEMDELDIDLVLSIDREAFRQLASVNPVFWYH